LARDLLMMEQQLLKEREAACQLRAQNQSFGQAMASLQVSRDQAVSEAKELRLRLDDINRTVHPASPSSVSKGEVWSLKNALAALQNDRERMVCNGLPKNLLEILHLATFNNVCNLLLASLMAPQLEQLQLQRSELDRLGSGELSRLTQALEEERRKAEEREEKIMAELRDRDAEMDRDKKELEMLR